MAQQLLSALIKALVAALIGAYGGYRYAIRSVPAGKRPSGSWQLSTCLAAGVAGSALGVAFEITLTFAFPNADTSQLKMIPLLFCLAIEVLLTQHFIKRGK